MTQTEALKLALERYMAAYGQALEAHGIELQQQQIEADKCAREALAQPEQEPVAWREFVELACAQIKAADDAAADRDYMLDSDDCISVLRGEWKGGYLNDQPTKPATPPQRKLTDEQIERLIFQSGGHKSTQNLMSNPMQVREHVELWNERIYKFARAIEAAHDIKE